MLLDCPFSFLEICRLCLTKTVNLSSVLDTFQNKTNVIDKISACLNVQIAKEDKFPKKVCENCLRKVEEFYEFMTITNNSQHLLKQLLTESLEDVENIDAINEENSDNMSKNGAKNADYTEENRSLDNESSIPKIKSEVANLRIKNEEIDINLKNTFVVNEEHLQIMNENESLDVPLIKTENVDLTEETDTCSENNFVLNEEQQQIIVPEETVNASQESCILTQPKSVQTKEVSVIVKSFNIPPSLIVKSISIPASEINNKNSNSIDKNLISPFSCVNNYNRNISNLENTNPYKWLVENYPVLAEYFPAFAEKTYKCEYCSKDFKRKSLFELHRRKHTGKRPFKWDFPTCNKACTSKNSLAKHKRSHSTEHPYKCDFPDCNKVFTLESSFFQHQYIHSKELQFKCDFPNCNKVCASKRLLTDHKYHHLRERPYKCDFPNCNMAFTLQSLWAQHKYTHSWERLNKYDFANCKKDVPKSLPTNRIYSISGPYKCNFPNCNKAFGTKRILAKHKNTHLIESPLKSTLSPKEYKTKHQVNAHKEANNKTYSCNHCAFLTFSVTALEMHISREHTKEYSFICNICGKGYFEKCLFTEHVQSHSDNKSYRDCNAKFTFPNELEPQKDKMHREVQCNICGKLLKHKRELKLHIRQFHEGIKYECYDCGVMFTDKKSLRVHLRKHAGRTYKRRVSKKSFDPKTSLTNNKKKNHTKRKITNNKLILNRGRKYSCNICNKKYGYKFTLNAHIKYAHPEISIENVEYSNVMEKEIKKEIIIHDLTSIKEEFE